MRLVHIILFTGIASLTAHGSSQQGPVDAYADARMPGVQDTWQSRFPATSKDATEQLGRYRGTFRGDSNKMIHFDVKIDPGFGNGQKAVLRSAMTYLAEELFAGRVWNCAEQQGSLTSPTPTVGDFQQRIYELTKIENPARTIHVTRFWYDATGIAGLARLNYIDPDGNFWITLNSQKIGNDVSGAFDSPRLWAGIIAHEILHNLGLNHPVYDKQGTRNEFIYAFGDCM